MGAFEALDQQELFAVDGGFPDNWYELGELIWGLVKVLYAIAPYYVDAAEKYSYHGRGSNQRDGRGGWM